MMRFHVQPMKHMGESRRFSQSNYIGNAIRLTARAGDQIGRRFDAWGVVMLRLEELCFILANEHGDFGGRRGRRSCAVAR
jgi:hypothetical protein